MALKIRLKKPNLKLSWPRLSWSSWLVRGVIAAVLLVGIIGLSVFTFYYNKYARIVDERLKQPLFANTAKIYAAPREVRPGQKISAHLIATELRAAGYTVDGAVAPFADGHVYRGTCSRSRFTPGPSPTTRPMPPPFTPAQARSKRSPTNVDSRFQATSWSRC